MAQSEMEVNMAEIHAANSMAADMDEWIIFTSETKQSLDEWLQKYPPSQITRAQGVGWICVRSPDQTDDGDDDDECDPCGLQYSFQDLVASDRGVSLKTITELSQRHHVLSGKWLFHASTGLKIDHLWELVARATMAGRLGRSAKVSVVGFEDSQEWRNKTHVTCIYVSDYTNVEEVMALEEAIRAAGIKASLTFKPDAYTYIGIYRQNQWKLRPTIYESNFDIIKGKSHVKGPFEYYQ